MNISEVWLIGWIVKPAKSQHHRITVTTIQVVTVTGVSVGYANMVTKFLDSED